ncbi:MAG: hypothetical protein KDB02_03755 [Acidimicrobiales bacterium]|nr:hypothetical protein [Acidimicrobiales bacterium]
MPAETHQFGNDVDTGLILELLATLVGVDDGDADLGGIPLDSVGVDDDVAVLHLWDAVAEEYGERSVGEVELDGELPSTLGELAELFHAQLGARGAEDADTVAAP